MSRVDIFQLGRALQAKFPDLVALDSPEIDLALEDLHYAHKSIELIVDELDQLQAGDYDGLSQVLSDLHGLFDHTQGHVSEALPSLDRLWRAASDRTRGAKGNQ